MQTHSDRLSELEAELQAERRGRLLAERLAGSLDLDGLLEALCDEIAKLTPIDGGLVNIVDDARENLVCQKAILPPEYAGMLTAYREYRFPIAFDDANAQSYCSRQHLLIDANNVQHFGEETYLRFERWQCRQLLVLPIFSGNPAENNLPAGTLMLFRQNRCFEGEEISALEKLLHLFHKPLDKARIYTQTSALKQNAQLANEEEQRFLQFVCRTNSLTTSQQIYDSILQEFLRRFSFDLGVIFIREEDHLALKKCVARLQIHDEIALSLQQQLERSPYTLQISDGASATAFHNNQHIFFKDVGRILHLPMSQKDKQALRLMKSPQSFMITPIRRDDRPVGVLWLASLSRQVGLADSQVKLIQLLCSFIGSAMSNASMVQLIQQQKEEIEKLNAHLRQRYDELSDIAAHDHLTGLNNFGSFETRLTQLIKAQNQHPSPAGLSLIIIDIDHFKRYNDTHGHVAGNEVLREVAQRIARRARKMDLTCRYGGEEFAIVLPNCNLENARRFAEQFREEIGQASFSTDSGQANITISAGCAEFAADDFATLVDRADKALYRAKQSGRNQVVLAPTNAG